MTGRSAIEVGQERAHSHEIDSSERVGSLAPPSVKVKTQALLWVVEGTDQGALFPLHGTSSWLGRKLGAPICLTDEAISLQHAFVSRRADGQHYIEDASSLNGTFVNDQRLAGPVALRDGDRIRLGDTSLRFAVLDAQQQKALLLLLQVGDLEPLMTPHGRHQIAAQLRSEIAIAARARQELALLLVDVDRLGTADELHAHALADDVSALVAHTIRRLCRPTELICRHRAGEVLVVARGTSRRNAEILAQRITRHVRELPLPVHDRIAPVSVSVGIACWESSMPRADGAALLDSAEAALRAAKGAGPSTVRRRETELPTGTCWIPLPHTQPPRRT